MELFTPLAVFAALALALSMRPWRMLADGRLASPLLAALVITPWFWAMPWLHRSALHLQLSGACLITLTLGWPLAVPVMCLVALATGLIAPIGLAQQADMALWLGIVPATLSVLLGAALRRWVWKNLFVYILGRGFIGTALCLFAANAMAQWTGHSLSPLVDPGLAMVARWLMSWGDAVLTGMLTAIFVAFKPHWLATWSDHIYVPAPRPPQG